MPPPALPFELQSMEQEVLRRVKGIIGDKTASEFQLQFVPRWLLDKTIVLRRLTTMALLKKSG